MRNLFALFLSLLVIPIIASATTVSYKNVDMLFTAPRGGMDNTLEDALVDYLNRAVPGSIVRGSFYQPEETRVAQALVAAGKVARGLDLRIVFDDSIKGKDYKAFRKIIEGGLSPNQYHVCSQGACIGSENNHNKFYIFSEVRNPKGGANIHNVVLSSSMNFSNSQKKKHNNTFVVKEDAALFRLFLNHAEDLYQERRDPNYLNGANGMGEGSGEVPVRVYFYPTLGPAEPVLDELKAATCANGGGTIRLIHSLVKEQYALDTIKELQRLKGTGCSVELIVRNNSDDNEWIDYLKKSGLRVWWNSLLGTGIHSKYTIIDALWPDGKGQMVRKKIVFTGSANLKSQSVFENDETVLRIEDPFVFATYLQNWNGIK